MALGLSSIRKRRERREKGRDVAHWSSLTAQVQDLGLAELRRQQEHAQNLKQGVSAFLHLAEGRLAWPRIGSDVFHRPDDADWSWRLNVLRGPVGEVGLAGVKNGATFSDEIKLFHDCPHGEIILRQVRNRGEQDLSPFALALDVFAFEGSFLSVAFDLPQEAVHNVGHRHLVRMDGILECDSDARFAARLNLQHGPNVESLVQDIDTSSERFSVEFDLAYMEFDENRTEKFWLDFLITDPQMSRVVIRDLTFHRVPRAEM